LKETIMNDDQTTTVPAAATAVEAPPESVWQVIKRVTTDRAREGDMYAAQVYLQMAAAERSMATLELPAVDDPASLEQAQAAVIAAIKPGGLTPRVAMMYSDLLENRRRAISTRNHEARLRVIEQINRDNAKSDWRKR
jgi:hypothetical protein